MNTKKHTALQGMVIIVQDLLVIRELEKITNTIFRDKEQIGTCWYTTNGVLISGIGIRGYLTPEFNFNLLVYFLTKIKYLTTLDLSIDNLHDISPLKNLVQLKSLRIRRANVNDITPIKYLKELNTLFLMNSPIKNINPIKKLHKLEFICFINLHLNNIQPLKGLLNLKKLEVHNVSILDISPISNMKQLTSLHLERSDIIDISPLSGLTKLRRLNLRKNCINDITPLISLKELEDLNLANNKIKSIPISLVHQFYDISVENPFSYSGLNLTNNPITDPPIEIIEQGKEAVLRYFDRKGKETFSAIQEAKLILVGEGAAGKTSLKLRLQNPDGNLPKGDERTRGIDVTHWSFENNFTAHIWDFGGQDVYYPVHRFFITDNSVFVLLASTRNQQHNFEYWIPTIYQFGGDSPIIIGQTCHDGNRAAWNDLSVYQSDTNFHIIKKGDAGFYRINLLNNNEGLDEIKDEIIHQLKTLPHCKKPIPESWVQVRNELENHQKMCIPYTMFKEICRNIAPKSFVNEEDFSDCCLFLHNIGSFFWYHKNTALRDWVVLKPELAVEAVYKIIDDKEIQNRYGHIIPSDFRRLWSDAHHIDSHSVLKEMLKEFRVAFSKKHDREIFILPSLLTSMPSNMNWDENPCITAEFEYNFMPKALVNQLSAELSTYIPINNTEEVWNNAVNIAYENTAKCQIKEEFFKKKISIKASGRDARPLMVLVMDSLKNITSAYSGVKYSIIIPCICSECAEMSQSATKHKYDELMRLYEERGRTKAYCNESDQFIPIDDLIFNVGLPMVSRRVRGDDKMKKITIFLASSKEMEVERRSFELFIGRENKRLFDEGIFLHLEIWEDFLDAMSVTRLQDEYNKAVKASDIFVSLFFSKVGKYTVEEFQTAYGQFIKSGKPYIYTFFKNAKIKMNEIDINDITSLHTFKENLKTLGHFPTEFNDSNHLEIQFRNQFDRVKDKL